MTQSTAVARRSLGFGSLLALGVNGIVGVGIFFAPSEVAALVPGAAGIAVYGVTALCLLPIALGYAALGRRFSEDGGPYVWARAAFGPSAGFAVGWVAYVSALFSSSAVIAGLAQHAGPLVGFESSWAQRGFAALVIAVLTGTAATGLSPSARVWSTITVLKLIPLLLLASLFAVSAHRVPVASATAAPDFARAALVVVFATQGFEIVPVPAGNARGSGRAIPAATVLSLVLAALLYLALHAACVAVVPGLAASQAPLVALGSGLGGPRLAGLVALGTNLSALGIAFGMFAMTPRYLAALGRPEAFGPWISHQDPRQVPQRALWLTAAVVLVFVLSGRLMELFALSSVAVLAQYGMSMASLVKLAIARQRGLSRWHAWPAPLALGAVWLIARAARRGELVVGAAVLAAGGLLVWLRRRFAQVEG
ncbi:MAG: APC family permease [Polyangiaceae bacterium]|nr:APC family permease [Polyangiaceae bacterium]